MDHLASGLVPSSYLTDEFSKTLTVSELVDGGAGKHEYEWGVILRVPEATSRLGRWVFGERLDADADCEIAQEAMHAIAVRHIRPSGLDMERLFRNWNEAAPLNLVSQHGRRL